jgi:hypothetical protein
MSFFYDLNKKLDSIRATPEVTHQQLNERDMSRAAKGIMKYGKDGMQALRDAEAEGKALDPVRKKYNKYDNKEVDEGANAPANESGAPLRAPAKPKSTIDKHIDKLKSVVNRPTPVDQATSKIEKRPEPVPPGTRVTSKPKGEFMGTIKGGVWTADPPKPGERGVPAPSGDPEGVKEAAGSIDYEKVLEAIAALYGDDMWDNDAMGDLAQDLEQAGPTDRELDFIIAKGKLPTRLKGIRFTNTDDVQFGHLDEKSSAPMTAKQKSFAKLAPPANKITFADKIAGAKKEVDEMLGDVAAEAMRSALGGGKGRNAGMEESAGGFTQADWDKVARKKRHLMMLNPNLEPEDAEQIAAEKLGYDYEEVLAWIEGDQNMEEAVKERSKGTAFDMSTQRVDTPKAGSTERGAKHDIKHSTSDPRYTGRTVTRRTDAQGISVGADDDADTQAGPRGRGRPKGTKGAIGAKGPSGRSKLMTREGEVDIRDQGEYDQEGDMAKDDIKTIVRHAQALSKVLGDNDNLPEWVQSKLAKIEGMMISIDEYMQNQAGDDSEEPIAEKAVSKQQQKFMGMAHAMQKGEKVKGASKELKKVAKTMKPKDTEDFAKTKHKGLPNKKKKEVDENSEDGRLTVKQTGPGKTLTTSTTGRVSATIDKNKMSVKPGKSDKQMDDDTDTASNKDTSSTKTNSMIGKGIYDSMNRELELMIAESMSINMSDSTEGSKSLTITATDEDALKLGMLLKNAGLGGGDDMHSHGEQPCATCGMPDCGCGDVQEAVDDNAPDYPTNTEQADNNFGYAGGLNKPKTDVAGDGQTTIPNTAVHTQDEDALRRMMEMAGMSQNDRLDEGMMDKIKGMLVPKLMKLLGPDADNIANAVRQATGGDLTPSKENAMKVVQALGIDKAATQGQSQMAEGIAGNWQGKLIQSLYTLGLLGSAAVTNWAYGPGRGTDLGVASGIITMIGVVLLMFAATFFSSDRGMVGAMGRHGNKGFDTNKGPNSLGEDDLDRMMEMAGIKIKNNLGPTSPDIARMSKDEVNAALRSGMNSKVDLGPTSPDIARMSKDEVDAALRSGMSPDISNMDPDSVNAEFGKDSIQRMKEMAGIQEFSVKLDSPPRTGSYPDQIYGKDRERYDAVQKGSGPESQRVNQYYQNKPADSYDSGQKYTDERDADYADRLNAVRAGRIANNELTPGEWIQKGTNAVRKAFGGQDKPLKPAKTVVDLDGPQSYPSARYVGSDEFNKRKYLDPKADAAYKARQKALFPDDFKEGKGDGNLANNAKPYDKVTQGDVIAGRLGKDEKGGKEKQVEESIFALTNQWKAYKG